MSDEKTISLDEYERDNLLWLVRCAGRLHLNTGDWVYMVRAKLEAIGGNPDNANWPPSMTEAHVQGINDMRTALATAIAERDAARDIWFCLECGITVPDAEHCCPTCGRDCIGFENGKPAHGMGAWLDKERALDAALAYQLKSPVTGAEQTLGHLMQERYGREARQWQANHDQRKAERDAAITERDALRGEVERLRLAADMLREIPRAALSADKVYREDWEELFTDEDGAALYLDTAVDRVLDRITRKEGK